MRTLLGLLLLAFLCGCARSPGPAPLAGPGERLPIEVEKGPEDALPKKKPANPRRR